MKIDSHNLNDLMYFSQVVEHGGFSAAERVLGISKSRLSRRLTELEASLGVRLLQRSTRKLALTEAGQLFYQHCQAMLSEAQAAVNVVQQLRSSPRGTVRVSVPVTISQTILSQILPEFMHRYPEVRVVMRVTNRVVDLFEDSIDIALRVRSAPPENANIVVRPLWRTQQMLVGALHRTQDLGLVAGSPELGHERRNSVRLRVAFGVTHDRVDARYAPQRAEVEFAVVVERQDGVRGVHVAKVGGHARVG